MNRVIVIGASSGGVKALRTIARDLPGDLAAAVVVVLHVGPYRSVLPELLASVGPLPAAHARAGEVLEAGRIYVAPPDRHVVVDGDRLCLSLDAKEHYARPAIDPLFRSAAVSYGPRAVGVILTGRLDDGTAGLQAIKAAGGTAVVQDPASAEVADMPRSAARYVAVDHQVELGEIAALLCRLAKERIEDAIPSDRGIDLARNEQGIFLGKGDRMKRLAEIASPSTFACPECHGSLWEIRDVAPRRFRCHTGHAYTIRTLQSVAAMEGEDALWNARRALQERSFLLDEMARSAGADEATSAAIREARARLKLQLDALEALMRGSPDPID